MDQPTQRLSTPTHTTSIEPIDAPEASGSTYLMLPIDEQNFPKLSSSTRKTRGGGDKETYPKNN